MHNKDTGEKKASAGSSLTQHQDALKILLNAFAEYASRMIFLFSFMRGHCLVQSGIRALSHGMMILTL